LNFTAKWPIFKVIFGRLSRRFEESSGNKAKHSRPRHLLAGSDVQPARGRAPKQILSKPQ